MLQSLTPSAQMQVTIPGYGAALLRLANASPNLTAAGVVNGATFQSGPVAPGEIVSAFGSALGPAAPALLSLTNPRLVANSLQGVQAYFDGVPAPLLYASAGQVNLVVPYSIAGKTSTQLQVGYLGVLSNPVVLQVAAAAPGVFSITGSGHGPGAILNARDGSVNSVFESGRAGRLGEHLRNWRWSNHSRRRGRTPRLRSTARTQCPSVSHDGRPSLPAQLRWRGAGLVSGVLQINAQVPAGLSAGAAVPVQIRIGPAISSPAVTLAVQ